MQYGKHKYHVFKERLPWGEFNGVTEASTIRDLVEVCRIKRKKRKEDHEQEQQDGSI